MDKIIVAAAQFLSIVGDKEKNYAKMEELARKAHAEHHADLLLFPETALTGCCVESREEAMEVGEPLDGEYAKKFQALSKELDMDIAFTMIERDGDKCYNTIALCEPDGNYGWYRKVHLPYMGSDKFVDRGDSYPVMDTRFGKIGMMICYDLRFPEVARSLALDGARLILASSCMVGDSENDGAKRLLNILPRARAFENRVYVLYSNWIGRDDHGLNYLGHSHLANIVGDILVEGDDQEGIISQEIDLSLAEEKSILAPWCDVFIFDDRQPQTYKRLMEK